MHTLQLKLSSRRSKALLCNERARPACFILQSCEDPRGAPQYMFWSCTKIKFQMVVCLVSQLLKNVASEIHKARAQMIGQCSMSTPDVKCSFGPSVPNVLDSLPCFSRLLWKPAPESQNQNTFRNPHCRVIFSYSDWKPKQKPSSDSFSWNQQLGRTLRALAQAIWPSPHEKSVLFFQFVLCGSYL